VVLCLRPPWAQLQWLALAQIDGSRVDLDPWLSAVLEQAEEMAA